MYLCARPSLCVCVCVQQHTTPLVTAAGKAGVCDWRGGRRHREQLGGKDGESRDSEKSISAEYLIKFKPSDLSLLPGYKATANAGERGGTAGGEEKSMVDKHDDHSVGI